MKDAVNNDNLYPVGTILSAKENPTLKLIVTKYLQRIYYCSEAENPEHNNFAYFEKELISPNEKDQILFERSEGEKKESYPIKDELNTSVK